MTEPVAYMWKTERGTILGFTQNDDIHSGGQIGIPLYTAEQLHPRVKMTQAEFDEFNILYKLHMTVVGSLKKVFNNPNYQKLNTRFMKFDTTQVELANLLAYFVPDLPDETIEIIPNMKWFVRSKKQYQPDMDQGISESGYLYLTQGNIYSIEYYETTTFKDEAQQFDTKEEAEKWKNPLTEAVQLPVEGE